MELYKETDIRNVDRGKWVMKFLYSRTQMYVVSFFIILLIIIYLFYFFLWKKYNVVMFKKYGEDVFTHPPYDPQLLLEARAADGLDINWVYRMLMASANK
jgi:hypothetical protein